MTLLRSSDGVIFEVEQTLVLEWRTIKDLIEADSVIPLPNVTSTILAKVIEYSQLSDDDEFFWDDRDTLYGLMLAANYLNIKSLLDLTCQTVADMIRGQTPAEIRRILNVTNDFTPEEEEQQRRENAWVFE